MSKVIIQKGNPTDTAVGNLWLDQQPDNITEVLAANGAVIGNGDIVVHIIDPSYYSAADGEVNTYLADRESDEAIASPAGLVLRDNSDINSFIALRDVGDVCAEAPAPPVELETFTVFGTNDDDKPFTAVITVDPDKVETAALEAGATSPAFTYLVKVAAILKGDQTDSVVS